MLAGDRSKIGFFPGISGYGGDTVHDLEGRDSMSKKKKVFHLLELRGKL